MLVIETITIALQEGDNPNNVNKTVLFKNCAPLLADSISVIKNTQIDRAKDMDV